MMTNPRDAVRLSVVCVLLVLALGCAPAQPAPDQAASFRAAIETHLDAVAARDIAALEPTLTQGNDLTMIGPDGSIWQTRQQYLEFHRQWFAAGDNGQYAYEIVRLVEAPTLAQALVRYTYTSTGDTGVHESVAWLSLTFALEANTWRLVLDQNTPISRAPQH